MSRSPGKAPPTDSTPPDQMIPNDPIGRTPPPRPNEPDRIPIDPNIVLAGNRNRYEDDYITPPNERIEDFEMNNDFPAAAPYLLHAAAPNLLPAAVPNLLPAAVPNLLPAAVPNLLPAAVPNLFPATAPNLFPATAPNLFPATAPNLFPATAPNLFPATAPNLFPTAASNMGIFDNAEALLAANLNEEQYAELYMRENQREMQVFAHLMANYQRVNEQDDELEEQARAQGNIPEAEPSGRKILGRAGGGIKVSMSTQTLRDTRGVDNAWLHDSRRRAEALCVEISNLINRLYHAAGNRLRHRHSIPKTPQKKSAAAASADRRRSVGEAPPHETEEDRRAAAERRFYFEIRRDMSGISNSAIYLRNSIPLPRPDEEQRFPSPESPPEVLLPVQGFAEARKTPTPPLAQQEDMAASGYQRDTTSGLANIYLEESVDVWRDRENLSANSKEKNTLRRKPSRNSPTVGHVPRQRSPLSYKSPHTSASKPQISRVKSAQKASGKDNEQQPSTRATEIPEAVKTGTFGAKPKISSTSVWGRGTVAASTPHRGKQSEVPAVSPASPIAPTTSLASDVTSASIGASSQDSRVRSRAASSELGLASSQASASDIVKEAASKATSAMLRELRGTRGAVYKKTYSKRSGADSSSQTSSGEQSQYQKQSTKSIERPRPAFHTSDYMVKRKPLKAFRQMRDIPDALKGKNVECILKGSPQASNDSVSSSRNTKGGTRVPKEASTTRISKGTSTIQASSKSGTSSQTSSKSGTSSQTSSKSGTSSQTSSKSGASSSSQMSSSESSKDRKSNERPRSRELEVEVTVGGKKKATKPAKFTSTLGRETRGVPGVLMGSNTECELKGRSRTAPATRVATTSTSVATGVTSTVSKDDTVTSLPKGSSSNIPKGASATKDPKPRRSDQASNAGASGGPPVFNQDDISLGLLRPRFPYLVTDPTPITISRSASDLTDSKPTSKETTKKKPHSY